MSSLGLIRGALDHADRGEALRAWCDEHNRRVLFPLLWILTATAFGTLISVLEGPLLWRALPPAALLLANLLLIVLMRRRGRLAAGKSRRPYLDPMAGAVDRQFRLFAIVYPIVATLVLVGTFWGGDPSPLLFISPFVLLFLRLNASDRWLAHFGLVAVAFADGLWSSQGAGDVLFGVLMVNGTLLGIGLLMTRRSRKRFLGLWRSSQERYREEQRMRQELEYAREVQLSMLPHDAPALPWLEMARLSLPATEVGGDYYDFFAIDDERMLVVIGDVAGHGLASGIVLASIRSGLTLLVDDIDDAPGVMARLSRMLRETSRTRVLVSLGLILFDRRGRVTVTSAGHPPALLWRHATQRVETIDLPALPLGTGMQSKLTPRVLDLDPGDTMLLYTDGLFEATDSKGDPLGMDALIQSFSAAAEEPLEDLKASIIRSVWEYRGEAEQEDDITLVAIRFSPACAHSSEQAPKVVTHSSETHPTDELEDVTRPKELT